MKDANQDRWFRGKHPRDQAAIVVLNATMSYRRGDTTLAGYYAEIEWAKSIDEVSAKKAEEEISARLNHLGINLPGK